MFFFYFSLYDVQEYNHIPVQNPQPIGTLLKNLNIFGHVFSVIALLESEMAECLVVQ